MANKFENARAKAEILEKVYNKILDIKTELNYKWDDLGTEHQEKNWRTGELVWEDDEKTIPKMVPDYGNVEKKEEDYTEDELIQIKVLNDLMSYLEKQV